MPFRSSSRRRPGAVPAFLAALLIALAAPPARAQDRDAAPPAVGVTTVAVRDITPTARFVGRAEAIDRVELVARVTGFLEERHFEQGGQVDEGELLMVLEKGPYEARLAQRRAELASAQAEVENAAAQLARGEELLAGDNIPAAEVDERRARLLMAEAKVLEAEAAIQSAELNLGYTDIHAPVAGRIGRSAYSVGAFVGPESGPLATVVSQDPIYVSFPVSQAVLTRARQQAIERGGDQTIVVLAELPTGERYEHPGVPDFAEVEVDAATDTLTIRATFPNPDGLLVPGQFLNVVLEIGDPVEALVVPSAALLVDQAGTYVLVVGDDDIVEQRRVTLARRGDGADAVVEQGLSEGERVVVEGIQKVRPGQQVVATPAGGAAADQASAGEGAPSR